MDDDDYARIGHWVGIIVAILTFVITWVASSSENGFLGFALGWLPGTILAVITYIIMRYLWGPIAVLIAIVSLWAWWDSTR